MSHPTSAGEAAEGSRHETPLLKVVTPNTTPEEIAAIVAVLGAMGGSAPTPDKPRSLWAAPSRRVRTPQAHGRGAWRASGLPH